jgi:hypothetical protein
MAYYPNNPNGQSTMANSAPVVIASDQSPVPINVSSDVFEQVVVGSRYNQVEVNFSQTDPDLIPDITVTKTNGGDASNASGQAVFSSGTNTNGGVKAVSNALVYYNPHSETFAAFSAVFTTGIANSYQRIGLYDANNGFFIGFNNTVFGVTLRKGGLDTFTGQGSFNGDTLTGGPTSNFKRNGVPEAVDFTKDNLYRIRFGWLGAAPIIFEIYSPDGDWVAFNIIKHPNTSTSASINNPDLPVTLDIQKTGAGATDLIMNTGCWGSGTTSDLKKLSDVLTDNSLAKTVKSVLAAKDAGGNYINIGATLTGNLETAINEVAAGVTFPITDNGGSITIDGTVSATQSGTWNINDISGVISLPTGASTESTLAALNGKVPANLTVSATRLLVDGSGVTQPVNGTVTANAGTGTFNVSGTVAATQSGTWNIGTLTSITNPVTVSGTVTASNTSGDVAHDSPDSGNPVKIGFQAETALPTAVANGDRTNGVADRYGRQLVSHIDPGMQVWKSGEYTSTQTGTNIWVPTGGNRFVITQLNIATGGSTAGLVTIWGAQTATTTYTPGTDQVFFRGVLTPTANATPGALIQSSFPMFSEATNDCLKITTSANMTIYIQVFGYEITP